MADETKIIYHIDDEETPYLVKISKGPKDVTLGDFKNILNRPSYKFFFKSMDDDFGVVKEEITDDEAGLPCVNGRVVAWLVTSSEGSASDVGRTFSESGSEPHDQQSVLSDPDSTGVPRARGLGSGDSRPPSFHYRCTEDVTTCGRTGLQSEKDNVDSELESVSSRQSHRHRPQRPPKTHRYKTAVDDSCEESSVLSSDLETTSVADSEDDRRSRISSLTDGSSLYHGRHRRRRRRNRMPHVQRCTSFSTITESTMSLNIITVTLNMDKANFLGISIVGQSGSRGDGGIHVGSVMKGGAVALDGRIDPGDMLLQVNDVDFQNMSNDAAVRVLREMVHKPGPITLTVAKCWDPSPQGYFTLPQSEPVRPINTEAWVQQLAAMRVEYGQAITKDMVNQSLGTMTSTSSSLTSSLPESDRFNDDNYCQLHVNSDMQVIVKVLASADSGLDVRDRMWLKITIPNAFIGSDLVDWLFSRVQGFTDRREARKYASNLLKAGYIRHTVNKITFSEQCYYVFGDLCGKMASMSIKEHDGSDQDTLAPLPQPTIPWGSAPPAYAGWRPPYPMTPQFADHHPYNQAMFQAPSQTGSGSPRSLSSGSQKSREKEMDRESRSSGGSSASDRSGSSKGDKASVKEKPLPKDIVNLPQMRDYGRLETIPDNIAASRSSFQIALANPCELFVDVM